MGEGFDRSVLDPKLLALFDGYVHGRLTRRQFLDRAAGVVAAGTSAAAVLAILSPDYALARQVDPEDPGISVGYKQYASPDGAGVMRGYLARPADTGHKLPGVVVIHENRGLNPYIEDVARRLAVAGFLSFAPDALTPFGGYPGNDDEGRELRSRRDGEEMAADFVAAVRYLKEHPDCTGKVGAVGFCFGGGMALRLATELPELDAAVAFYGRHPDAARIKSPLLIHHAELDERINTGWPGFETALRASDVDYREYTYPDANHGFHNDTTPRFDAEAAQLAWSRTVQFFNQHLVANTDA
jgi:carboxymethylenebutenolidase